MKKEIKSGFIIFLIFTFVSGILYPLFITGIAQIVFKTEANGSLIELNNKVIGSKLIGQSFTEARYFHSRPSEVNYDASKSGGSNLGPTNKKLINRITSRYNELQNENPNSPVPVDLITSSASGLDPHITLKAAFFQVPRIAKARNIPEEDIINIIKHHIERKLFGFIGEERVNVLLLNIKLDRMKT